MSIPKSLTINEILLHLFEHVAETRHHGRRTLSSLARTCRTFSEPALDILWRDLRSQSLEPLLRLLPSDLTIKTPKGWDFTRSLVPGDWHLFMKYARRIRRISYNEGDKLFSPNIFAAFARSRPVRDLMPQLLELDWSAVTPDGLHGAILFLSPTLTTVSLAAGFDGLDCDAEALDEATVTVIQMLHLYLPAPRIERLHLHLRRCPVVVSAVTKLMLTSFGLREFVGRCLVTPSAIAHLSKLPNLKRLVLDRSRPDQEPVEDVVLNGPSFTDLECLEMKGDIATCDAILRMVNSKVLDELTIKLPPLERADHLSRAVSRIPRSITCLEVYMNCPEHEEQLLAEDEYLNGSTEYDITMSTLAPMLSWNGLVSLTLWTSGPINICDSDLLLMADAWPHLELLDLCPSPDIVHIPMPRPRLTVCGLVPFVERCPNIAHLGLLLDATRCHLTPADYPSLEGICAPSCQYLDFGSSWIARPASVARLLSDLFPSATLWSTPGGELTMSKDYKRGWAETRKLMAIFQEEARTGVSQRPPSVINTRPRASSTTSHASSMSGVSLPTPGWEFARPPRSGTLVGNTQLINLNIHPSANTSSSSLGSHLVYEITPGHGLLVT